MGSPKFLVFRHPPYEQKHRPRIYPGDSFPVVYEARQLDPNNFNNVHGLPESVVSATAKLRSSDADDWVELGGTGVTEAVVDITPPNGDMGAILTYSVPSVFTSEGEYILYIRATFPDGEVYTSNRRFQVQEYGR